MSLWPRICILYTAWRDRWPVPRSRRRRRRSRRRAAERRAAGSRSHRRQRRGSAEASMLDGDETSPSWIETASHCCCAPPRCIRRQNATTRRARVYETLAGSKICLRFTIQARRELHRRDRPDSFSRRLRDPNCLVTQTGESPLHLALKYNQIEVIEELLRREADPDLANAEGSTPLHVISEKFRDIGTSKKFFEISEEINRPVRIDAKDKKGRTPLQCAVARLLLEIVELLLDRGADLSSFIFPVKNDFTERLKKRRDKNFKLRLASGLIGVVECLEKRGYQLDRRDALMIMQFFAKLQLFEKSATFAKTWYNDEEFVEEAKETETRRGLSLHEVIQLRPEEAAKLLSGMDYFRFAGTTAYRMELDHACSLHLCEKLSRRFFQRWALEPFWVLIHRRLPLKCCDMILEELMNKDLRCICAVAKGQSSR
ncbi:unnamed protein product [Trichogramma brassicae]|uniref:SOCS box domain-containing protein n=1 Tax=Trichogramma brassicae TaxID=86971 RepID=A0A6H5I685_9HYME|nr:unnamed protein product [Trichogramma brassicae]